MFAGAIFAIFKERLVSSYRHAVRRKVACSGAGATERRRLIIQELFRKAARKVSRAGRCSACQRTCSRVTPHLGTRLVHAAFQQPARTYGDGWAHSSAQTTILAAYA